MKIFPIKNLIIVGIALIGLVMASTALAVKTSPLRTTTQDVQKKIAEAAAAIKVYSIDRRDEAVQEVKIALGDIDDHIDQWEFRIQQKWDQMDRAARQQVAFDLALLRKERNKVAEWYGGLEHCSSQAWEDVKAGFLKSCHDLQDAFAKAKRDFY